MVPADQGGEERLPAREAPPGRGQGPAAAAAAAAAAGPVPGPVPAAGAAAGAPPDAEDAGPGGEGQAAEEGIRDLLQYVQYIRSSGIPDQPCGA